LIEELAGPGGGVPLPELLEDFLWKVCANRLQVVAEEFAEPEVPLVTEIPAALEEQPAGLP